ncbi:ELKS/Rab6-interacting/CAST family member 1 [Liparis tanakae]|uniref:ELKS/Rab6-interacting/CAST family member 1 n=1 Tax=Liparis tanakae TaxID=230148 RepID=A0A4Z2GHX1_9TELE|nr:ELKS/Rab6-interacting/CAST family member 1 [Liparis tanakae]
MITASSLMLSAEMLSAFLDTSVLDLKEKASSLASSTLKKDSRLKSLEIGLDQKKEECVKLENQLKKAISGDSRKSLPLAKKSSSVPPRVEEEEAE